MINGQVRVSGVVTYWTMAEHSSHRAIADGFGAIGCKEYAPPPVPPAAALRSAL